MEHVDVVFGPSTAGAPRAYFVIFEVHTGVLDRDCRLFRLIEK